jgi:hypothetical protein
MSRLQRIQRVAFWVAVVSAAMGFMTSAGCRMLPAIPSGWVGWLHAGLLVLGAVAGFVAFSRGREIDQERWRVAEDPSLTSGERDYAHKHAERERRSAATSLLAAPLMLGYWLAYQVVGEGEALAAQLLPVTALVGSIVGWIAARTRLGPADSGEPPRP